MDKPVEVVDNSLYIRPPSKVLGVFCKAPVAGQVKTRLCPPLQLQQAAELYRVALRETLERFSNRDFALVICHAGPADFFADNFPNLRRQPQVGDDLGARMAQALAGFFAEGCSAAAIIGSDSPDLPLATVEQAFAALEQTEVAIAPALDGGYVLIGESRHRPELFTTMPWSEPHLMEQTRELLTQQQIPWSELPDWEDIDDASALGRLLERSPTAKTATYIRQQFPSLCPDFTARGKG